MPAVPPPFIIGVFSQPISSFQKWKDRGINTLVSHEPEGGRIKKSDWEAAAAAANLFFMDYPSDDPQIFQNEISQPNRIAFMQDDEPDLTRQPNTDRNNADGWTKPEVLAARYARCKSAAPNLPVFVNFAGTAVTPDAYKGEKHLPYISQADWLAHDWYVKNKNWQRYPVSLIGKAMDRLAAWSQNKPQFVFIECSDQKISPLGRPPTPDEVEEEVNLAIAKGARGIIYFPQRPPPGFQFDATTPELAQRITQINQRLASSIGASPTPIPPPAPVPNEPTAPLPPAQNEPNLNDVVNQLKSISSQLEQVAQELAIVKNRSYQVSFDLAPANS